MPKRAPSRRATARACLLNQCRFAGEAGLPGACSGYSDTLLAGCRESMQGGFHPSQCDARHRRDGDNWQATSHLLRATTARIRARALTRDTLLSAGASNGASLPSRPARGAPNGMRRGRGTPRARRTCGQPRSRGVQRAGAPTNPQFCRFICLDRLWYIGAVRAAGLVQERQTISRGD
jgi:hypothetical protein